jgi:hypothetical protein
MVVAAFATTVCALIPTPAQADVSRAQAARKALTALDARKGADALVVFGTTRPVRSGARITQAGPGTRTLPAGAVRGRLARAGVRSIRAGEVLRADAPAWLFYADEGPNQAFEHPGRVVLVERASGEVHVSGRLRWVPLVDGKRPAFFRSAAAYQSTRYRVLDRPYSDKRPAPATARAAAAGPAAKAAQQRLADALAAQRSCALRVSDSLGDFYDFGRVDKTRAALGRLFGNLAQLNPGFVSQWYRPASGRTPLAAAQALVDRGCRDLFLYVAGGSTRSGDMVVGLRSSSRRTLQWHVLDIDALEALVRRNPATTFKLAFDVPYAGKVAEALKDERNVSVLLTAGGPDEPSFSYLPQILGPRGLERNAQNPFQLLEFTNTLIRGFERFVTAPDEIDHAIAEQAAGRSDSVLAWSLARSLAMGPSPFSSYVLGTRTTQRVPVTTPAASAINHAPVGTTPPQVVREDTPGDVTLTAYDVDRDPLTFTVLAPPTRGTLTGTAPFLRYTPERDFFGVDRLTYRVSDGRGGTDTQTVTIAVTPDNDAPSIIVGPSGTPPVFTENGAPVTVDDDLTIFDVDSTQLTGARVDIASGFAGGDQLAFTPAAGITGAYDAATGVLRLTGTASVAAYRAALRSVTFGSTSDDPGTARTIRLRADDADENGIPASRAVTVVPSNDAPVLELPGAQTTAEDAPLALTGVRFTDPDAGAGPVQVALGVTHGTLSLGTTSGLTFTAGDGTADVATTFRGTPAAVNAALAGLTFTPAAEYAGSAELTVAADDLGHTGGTALTDDGTVAITVTSVDDAPVNTVPGPQSLTEDVEATLSGTFAVADVDSSTLTTTLALPGGTVTVDASGAATVTGNATGSVTIAGTIAAVDAALGTVKARGPQDVAGARTLTVTTTDGSSTDTDAVALDIAPVNDAPVLTRPAGTQTTVEDEPLTFAGTLAVADVDAGTSDVEAALTVAHGTLSTGPTLAGLTATGTGTGALTLTGTVGAVNDALDGLTYTPAADRAGADALVVSVSDLGHTGAGGVLTDTETIDLAVTAANDAPVVTLTSGTVAFTEGDPATLVDGQLELTDVDDTTLAGAVVTLAGRQGGDALAAAPPASITTSYDAGTGRLTLAPATPGAEPSVADVRAALRTVRFSSTTDAPTTSRTVTVVADDGDATSTPRSRSIAITPVNDVPVLAGPASATLAEDGAEPLALGVADPDAGTVTLALTADHGTIELATTTGLTVTGDGTATLTVSGDVARADAALDGLTYRPGPDYHGPDTLHVTVDDGDATDTHDVALTVTAVNDRPTVATTAGSTAWTEGSPAVRIDTGVTVADVDDADLEGATVVLANGRTGDRLVFPDAAGLTESYDAATRTLTVTGTASIAAYQSYLRSVEYESTSGAPTAADRTVELRVSDGDLVSTAATKVVAVSEINSPPVVTTSAGAAAFTEDAGPVAVDGGLTVTDADSPTLAGATVAITGGYDEGADTLAYTPVNGIAGTFDPDTATLTLTGTKTPAEYEQALRAVAFDSSTEVAGAARTVSFRVDDGADASDVATRAVTVTSVNDKPVVTTSAGTAAFSEGGAATVVDPDVDVTDVDSPTLASATVTVTGLRAGDVLAADTGATGLLASYTGGVLTISGTASLATYRAVLRTVTFGTPSATPGASRTIAFRADDGAAFANLSDPATRTVAIAQLNDAPVVTTSNGSAAYTENGAAVAVDPGLAVTDGDSPTLDHATVTITGNRQAGDVLAAADRGNVSGAYDAATGTLTVTGVDTVATYQAFLRDVTYRTTSDAPDTGARTVAFAVDDGETVDSASNVATRAVAVTAVNDAPVTTVPSARTVAEDATLTLASPNAASVADVDLGAAAMQVRLTATDGTLTLPSTTGLTFSEGSGTADAAMTFTGTLATVNARLDGLSYAPAANYHGPATITVTADDGGATGTGGAQSDSASIAVTVTPVNDAPVLTQPDAGALTYTEDVPSENHTLAVAPNLTLADVDDTTIAGATVTLTGAETGDALVFADQNGITGAYAAGVLTLTGAATKAQYEAALRTVAFRTTSENPSTATRTAAFRADDGHAPGNLSNVVTRDIAVVPTNDAPVAGANSFTGAGAAVGNTALVVDDPTDGAPATSAVAKKSIAGDVLANDTDPEGQPLSVVPATTTTANGGTVTIQADGDFVYESDPADACAPTSDSFTYTVTDGAATGTGTVTVGLEGCVWYVSNAAAGNSGTSTAPFDTITQARDASGPNHTVFVLRGDGSAYDTGTGYQLDAGERLIGELSGLSVGGATLAPAAAGQRPTLAATGVRVVALDDANTVRGLRIDPTGAGAGGLLGAAGDVDGTIDDVTVDDGGTGGTQPALDLGSATGTWTVTGLKVAVNQAGWAVYLNNASQTVDFDAATITNTGGAGLHARYANMATSSFDAITTTGGGVYLRDLTGTTRLGDGVGTDLDLNVNGTCTGALLYVGNAGTVHVDAAGTDTVTATTCAAVNVANTAGGIDLDRITSTNSNAIAVWLTNPPAFRAGPTSSITGASLQAIDISQGSSDVTYEGTINEGASGNTVYIGARTGGQTRLTGSITDGPDTAGGIRIMNNTGGTIELSGASKTFETTGANAAVEITNNTGATVNLTGGGLVATSAAARAFTATGGGTVSVTGTGNRVTGGTGGAVAIQNTRIGDADVTFERVSSTGAANGIALASTGNAQGAFAVTGAAGTCTSAGTCTGGAITSSTGAGVLLSGVPGGVSLTRMAVLGSGARGIDATNVSGASALVNSVVTGSAGDNVRFDNDGGALDLDVTSTTSGQSGGDGLQLRGDQAAAIRADVTGSTFAGNADDGFQLVTSGAASGAIDLNLHRNTITADGTQLADGALVTIAPSGTATTRVSIDDNDLDTSKGSGLILNPAGSSSFDATVTSNSVLRTGSGFAIDAAAGQSSSARMRIANNVIDQFKGYGLHLRHGEGNGSAHYVVTSNTVANPAPGAFEALVLEAGALSSDTVSVCADISANAFTNAGGTGAFGVEMGYQVYPSSTLRMPGFGGTMAGYLQGRNTGLDQIDNYDVIEPIAGPACQTPALPPAP